jgi:hypothetical protein
MCRGMDRTSFRMDPSNVNSYLTTDHRFKLTFIHPAGAEK